MNRTFRERVSTVSASIEGGLLGLIREMAPVVLFFFIAFLLIFVMFELFVSQYEIEFSAFTKAAVAALVLGKVVPLLDWAQSGYRFETHRRAVVIAGKTFIYDLVVIVLGIGEKILHNVREAGSLREGFSRVVANANLDRFLGLVLLISLTVGTFLVMQEITRAMRRGTLFKLFFGPPQVVSRPQSRALVPIKFAPSPQRNEPRAYAPLLLPYANFSQPDQNPFAGGIRPLSRCMTYLLTPEYGFPSASTSEVG